MEKEEGWTSEESDGGVPAAPIPSSASKGKKGSDFQSNGGRGKYSAGPWRPQASQDNRQPGGQRQLWEDTSRDTPPARPSMSSLSGKAAPFTSRTASLEDYMKNTTLSDDELTKTEEHRSTRGNQTKTKEHAVSSWTE
jgi:hypothetical protein